MAGSSKRSKRHRKQSGEEQSFANRKIIQPRYLDGEFFSANFPELYGTLCSLGLIAFCKLNANFSDKLIKDFYSNLNQNEEGVIESMVGNCPVVVRHTDWPDLCGLHYSGYNGEDHKLLHDRSDTLLESATSDLGIHKKIKAGEMDLNTRLLHKICCCILRPKPNNQSVMLVEDIPFIRILQQEKKINWPFLIISYMMKAKKTKGHQLPYAFLISKILEKHGINGAKKTVISRIHILGESSINMMHIKKVNGVWMFSRKKQDVEDEDYEEFLSAAATPSSAPTPTAAAPSASTSADLSVQLDGIHSRVQSFRKFVETKFSKTDEYFDRVLGMLAFRSKESEGQLKITDEQKKTYDKVVVRLMKEMEDKDMEISELKQELETAKKTHEVKEKTQKYEHQYDEWKLTNDHLLNSVMLLSSSLQELKVSWESIKQDFRKVQRVYAEECNRLGGVNLKLAVHATEDCHAVDVEDWKIYNNSLFSAKDC